MRYAEDPDPACARDGVVILVSAISIEVGDLITRASLSPSQPDNVIGYVAMGADVRDRSLGQRVSRLGMAGAYAERRAVKSTRT